MELNHATLLSLGFLELPHHKTRYQYKRFTGRLENDGRFYFHGFAPPVASLTDLKYMLMLIDYKEESAVATYSSNMN